MPSPLPPLPPPPLPAVQGPCTLYPLQLPRQGPLSDVLGMYTPGLAVVVCCCCRSLARPSSLVVPCAARPALPLGAFHFATLPTAASPPFHSSVRFFNQFRARLRPSHLARTICASSLVCVPPGVAARAPSVFCVQSAYLWVQARGAAGAARPHRKKNSVAFSYSFHLLCVARPPPLCALRR